eukprot:UN12775
MYLFEYLLSVSNEVIGEIQTSLNVRSYLPTLIDQYNISIRRESNHSKSIETTEVPQRSDEDEATAIIMEGFVTLIQPKEQRKA